MRLVTAKEMRALDQYAINMVGIPGVALMELAGNGTAKAIMERWPVENTAFLIVAGKGNNGGDGYVIARHLFNQGAEVNIILIGSEKSISGDALINLKSAKALKIPIFEINSTADIVYLEEMFLASDIIVDAIFGTGLDRDVTGVEREIVSAINASAAIVISVDIPSGLNSDTGAVMGSEAIYADLTVTFGFCKIGHYTSPGFEYCGEIVLVDISIPPISHGKATCFLLTEDWVKTYLPERPRGGHKGTFGHVLIIAGSRGKVGAAIMSSEAAISMGSGLVTVVAPSDILNILMNRLTEAMCEPLSLEDQPNSDDIKRILTLTENRNVIVFGPGIPKNEGMFQLLKALIEESPIPIVIDADGLNLLAKDPSILKNAKRPVILTPHPGEMAKITGMDKEKIQSNRIPVAVEFAKEYNVFILLKGARSILVSPKGRVAINPTGNPGMGTGGTGDILTGMVASIIAQNMSIFEATSVALFLHGRSGDLAAQEKGEYSLRAMDLIKYLPTAFYSLDSQKNRILPNIPGGL
jgi:ADP-dependent NAD(P)H-hydrate dehydratase / NAD(P)H-hydrate epimerase